MQNRLLDEVYDFLGRFVAYPTDDCRVAHTLWIAHTHLMDHWENTPRLAFLSPEPGSGKSRALEVTELLVPNPVQSVNATPAYLFRKVSDGDVLPTVLYDEIDTVFGVKANGNEELRGLINAGHRRGAKAGRCVTKGDNIVTEDFPAYCAVAMGGLGELPDTILTRSVVVRMKKRKPTEKVEPFRQRINGPEGEALRDKLAAWANTVKDGLKFPEMPEGIEDRNADVWEPLIAIADLFGAEWSRRARVSAVSLVSHSRKDGGGSLAHRALRDCRIIFASHDKLFTLDLLKQLHDLEEAPWKTLKAGPLDDRHLAKLLGQYDIASKQIRIGEKTKKGYDQVDFTDAWERYLQPAQPESSEGATAGNEHPAEPHTAPAEPEPPEVFGPGPGGTSAEESTRIIEEIINQPPSIPTLVTLIGPNCDPREVWKRDRPMLPNTPHNTVHRYALHESDLDLYLGPELPE